MNKTDIQTLTCLANEANLYCQFFMNLMYQMNNDLPINRKYLEKETEDCLKKHAQLIGKCGAFKTDINKILLQEH
jgi:hypothetical protein